MTFLNVEGGFSSPRQKCFSKVIKMKNNMTKKQIFEIIGVVALCALIVVGAVLGVVLGVNMPSANIEAKQEEQQSPVVIETVQEQGITLMSGGATTASDGTTTKTITATVTPSDATNPLLGWSLAFKNPNSTWAKYKSVSDYVFLSVDADTFSCTLTFKQAFGEQIILSCFSKSNSSIKATATIDYAQRLTALSFLIQESSGSFTNAIHATRDALNYTIILSAQTTTSPYTILDDFEIVSSSGKVSQAMKNILKVEDSGGLPGLQYSTYNTIFSNAEVVKSGDSSMYTITFSLNKTLFAYTYSLVQNSTAWTKRNEVSNSFYNALVSGMVFVDLEVRYQGKYSSGTLTAELKLGQLDVDVAVNSVSLNPNSVVF